IVVLEIPKSLVTFTFKAVSTDSVITTGTSEIFWNKVANPWASDSVRIADTNGQVVVEFELGVEYEISAKATASLEDVWITEYTAFVVDGVHKEQRALRDTISPLTFDSVAHSVSVYKFLANSSGNFYWLRTYMSRQQDDGNSNIGTRRFGDDDLNVPIWWRLQYVRPTYSTYIINYLPPDSTLLAWTDELIAEFKTIPYVGLQLYHYEGEERPNVPHIEIRRDPSFPAMGANSTSVNDETHEIISGNVIVPDDVGQHTFNIEFFQAVGDVNDMGGRDPDIREITPPYFFE
ncbi:hypothetical protein LCGC14_3107290, partial [marine sediment metagenome]